MLDVIDSTTLSPLATTKITVQSKINLARASFVPTWTGCVINSTTVLMMRANLKAKPRFFFTVIMS